MAVRTEETKVRQGSGWLESRKLDVATTAAVSHHIPAFTLTLTLYKDRRSVNGQIYRQDDMSAMSMPHAKCDFYTLNHHLIESGKKRSSPFVC